MFRFERGNNDMALRAFIAELSVYIALEVAGGSTVVERLDFGAKASRLKSSNWGPASMFV